MTKTSIKRELIKHHYFVVQREERKILSRVRWHPKTFTTNNAKANFKESGHIRKDVYRKVRTNVVETFQFGKQVQKNKKGLRQYVIQLFQNGRRTEIITRSIAKTPQESVSKEEKSNIRGAFLRAIGMKFKQESDEKVGAEVLSKQKGLSFKEGFVFYTPR